MANPTGKGGWKKGQSGNPHGRPAKAVKLRRAALDAATQADVKRVIKAMAKKAIRGDTAAARVYLEYTVGKPQQMIDLTTAGESLNAPQLTRKQRKLQLQLMLDELSDD